MTINVLEHDGLYTAYRLIIRRGDDGRLFESVKQIDIPFPPVNKNWKEWVTHLNDDQLEVGLQVFFDKWNFGNGTANEQMIYMVLCEERDSRSLSKSYDKAKEAIKNITKPHSLINSKCKS